MNHPQILAAAFLLLAALAFAATKTEWRSRTIYQLLTDRLSRYPDDSVPCNDLHKYCGGTFKGISGHLDYIKRMGFDAIWISPIPENQGQDYHGYAMLNMYKVNPHFGTADDLKFLVKECHKRGIWVMLDVVANHVACIDKNYSAVTPFDKEEYYHQYCEINFEKMWENRTMRENCRLFCLPDLNQSHPFVRSKLKEWIGSVSKEYGFDGIRIDTVAHVDLEFWKEYAEASGVFQVGEVFNGDASVVAEYQSSLDSMLNYPLYYGLQNAFKNGKSMLELKAKIDEVKKYFKDVSVLGNFVDNHDNARFLNITYDYTLFKNALTYVLLAEGIPIVYYGSEQGFHGGADPENRETLWGHFNETSELYRFVQTTIAARKAHKVWLNKYVERFADDKIYAFSRGPTLVCVTNTKEKAVAVIKKPFPNGSKLCNVYNARDCVKVKNGELKVTMTGGQPKIYVHAA